MIYFMFVSNGDLVAIIYNEVIIILLFGSKLCHSFQDSLCSQYFVELSSSDELSCPKVGASNYCSGAQRDG
eukprot:5488576-Ditylum_brightwellii.AAC.1